MEKKGLPLKEPGQQVDWRESFQGWGLSWIGLLNNQKGEWWLLAQVVLICAHILPSWSPELLNAWSWPAWLHVSGLMLFVVGLGLALQGFLALGPSLSPLPDPKPNAALITSGVYGRCRHPLYRAVVICSVGVVLAKGSLLHLALFLLLVAVLNGKAHREEKRLCAVHPDYLIYRSNTPAILPRIPGLDWRKG